MTLPLKGELTPNNQVSPEFEFVGEVSILVEGGSGSVAIQRSVKGSEYFTLTSTSGEKAEYSADGGVSLNAELSNKSSSNKYRLKGYDVKSPIKYTICK